MTVLAGSGGHPSRLVGRRPLRRHGVLAPKLILGLTSSIKLSIRRRSGRDRIKAAAGPGVTAHDALRAQPTTTEDAEIPDSFLGVFRTCWCVPAAPVGEKDTEPPMVGREGVLVEANRTLDDCRKPLGHCVGAHALHCEYALIMLPHVARVGAECAGTAPARRRRV